MIPFVSKGGHGICQEKTIYRWGGPRMFVSDLYTTLSGFSLTEGMTVRLRSIFEEKKNGLSYKLSAEVTFEVNSAVNNMLRGPVLTTLKNFEITVFGLLKKLEKTRKSGKGNKKSTNLDNDSEFE
jgi:hypothetical protein